MRVIATIIVQAKFWVDLNKIFLFLNISPVACFLLVRKGPAGLFLPDEEVRVIELSNKRASFFIDG